MTSNRNRSADIIASSSNPGIKTIRSLHRRKFRQQERAFIVEGVRAVADVLASGMVPRAVYLREGTDPGMVGDIPPGVPVRTVVPSVFDALTDTVHPQGMLAIVPMLEEAGLPDVATSPLVMVLDGVRDPGNMGTLLRSAAGAGVDHVVIAPECVDPYHPRSVRAGMGAHYRIGFSHRSWDELRPYLTNFDIVALADARGNAEYDTVGWTAPAVIIVGGEAFGPTSEAHASANVRVSIPLANGVESLNAGVAGSLLAFEAARQRRLSGVRGSNGA